MKPLLIAIFFWINSSWAQSLSVCHADLNTELVSLLERDKGEVVLQGLWAALNSHTGKTQNHHAVSLQVKDLWLRHGKVSSTPYGWLLEVLITENNRYQGHKSNGKFSGQGELRKFLQEALKNIGQALPLCLSEDPSCLTQCQRELQSSYNLHLLRMSAAPIELHREIESSLRQVLTQKESTLSHQQQLFCGNKRFEGGEKNQLKSQPRKPPVGKLIESLFKQVEGVGVCDIGYNNPGLILEQKDKRVCCEDKMEWKKRIRFSLYSGSADFRCRAFYGVPHIAELGVKVGVKIKIGLAGTLDPGDCNKNKKCVLGNLPVDIYSSLYTDLLSGGATVQGGFKWRPRLQAEQCFADDGNKDPFKLKMKAGNIELFYEYISGWGLLVYEGAYTVYENNAIKEVSLPIF